MRGSIAALFALGATALILPAAPALATPEEANETPRPRRHRSAEVLLDMSDSLRGDREPGAQIRIRKHYGLEYSQQFASDQGPPVIFSIQGPRMPHKRFGLTFEIRF